MREKKLEVLAPAGSFESLRAAVNAGADAVYMGGSRFGARAYAQNPEGENLLAAIDYAHLHGVRLYLTVNTLLKTRELERNSTTICFHVMSMDWMRCWCRIWEC